MNNGTRKGGLPAVMRALYSSPGFEDLWQMHFSLLSGQEYTAPGMFIANGIDDQQERDAGRADAAAAARSERATAAGAQRARVLDQAVRAGRRDVHRDERPQWILEGVPARLT